MKKLVYITLMMVSVMLMSCEQPNSDGSFYGIQKIEYEGHTYLLYRNKKKLSKVDGITHDMNCKCLKQENFNKQ